MRQRLNDLVFGWHNIDLFAVPPARRGLLNAVTPSFWHNLKRPRRSLVAVPLCFSYF